jgi:hypothetical protein
MGVNRFFMKNESICARGSRVNPAGRIFVAPKGDITCNVGDRPRCESADRSPVVPDL